MGNIKIKKVKKGYILDDACGGGKHSHFFNRRAARRCLTYINKGILPDQPYFVESCRRLLSKKEFKRLRHQKKKEKYWDKIMKLILLKLLLLQIITLMNVLIA